jgi:methylmalonyl-CoA/ethylmalonyl-CoA epimerase
VHPSVLILPTVGAADRQLLPFGTHPQYSAPYPRRMTDSDETRARVPGALGVLALDHTAVAVRDLEAGLELYGGLLGGVPATYEESPARGFRWLTLEYPNGSTVELLEPIGSGGFLHEFLARHGEGVHHLTFMVADLRQAVARGRANGLRIVDEDYSDPHWQEAFISPRSAFGTIVQLAQSTLALPERDRVWAVPDHLRRFG